MSSLPCLLFVTCLDFTYPCCILFRFIIIINKYIIIFQLQLFYFHSFDLKINSSPCSCTELFLLFLLFLLTFHFYEQRPGRDGKKKPGRPDILPLNGGPLITNLVSEYELQEVVFAATLNLYVPACNDFALKGNPKLFTNGALSLLKVSCLFFAATLERSLTKAKPEMKKKQQTQT